VLKKKKRGHDEASKKDDAVLLEDLAPRDDVRGGSGKIRFGQEPRPRPSPSEERSGLRKRQGKGE
jgi:hypothetical protein